MQPSRNLSPLSESFTSSDTLVSRAAALTAEAASGIVTQMSATMGRPRSNANGSPSSGSRWERGGSLCAAAWPHAARGAVGAVGPGGPEGHAEMDGSVVAAVAAVVVAAPATASVAAAAARQGEPVAGAGNAGGVVGRAVAVGAAGCAAGGTIWGGGGV